MRDQIVEDIERIRSSLDFNWNITVVLDERKEDHESKRREWEMGTGK